MPGKYTTARESQALQKLLAGKVKKEDLSLRRIATILGVDRKTASSIVYKVARGEIQELVAVFVAHHATLSRNNGQWLVLSGPRAQDVCRVAGQKITGAGLR